MSLLEKMLKAGNIKSASVLSKSSFFNVKEVVPTDLPILNIAFSGSLDGGLLPGLTVVAGASKSFKTMLSLYCMKAYLDKYKDGVAILYDSEFGITPDYLESFEIDIHRVIHIPIENVFVLDEVENGLFITRAQYISKSLYLLEVWYLLKEIVVGASDLLKMKLPRQALFGYTENYPSSGA